MVVQAGVGTSVLDDAGRAGKEAASRAFKDLGSDEADFAFIFSTDRYQPNELVSSIDNAIQNIPSIGCCGAGIISQDQLYENGVQVCLVKSDEHQFIHAVAHDISKGAEKAGTELGNKLKAQLQKSKVKGHMKTAIVLPDGLSGNPRAVSDGVFSSLGTEYSFAGGGTGDNLKFRKTYQIFDGKVYEDSVVGALIFSKSRGIALRHGWTPIGDYMIATNVEDTVVNQIDGNPAFFQYSRFFEKRGMEVTEDQFPTFSMQHPFGIPGVGGTFIIRDPLSVNKAGGIQCVADVPNRSVMHIMKGDRKSIIAAAVSGAKDAAMEFGKSKSQLLLVFDCVSRLLLLEDQALEEIQRMRDEVGSHVKVAGIFSFGEIGSLRGGLPAFHNKSVSLLLL